MAKKSEAAVDAPQRAEAPPITCGVIMPLSAIDSYTADHWADVQEILFDAIDEAGFAPRVVSDADEVGVIHGRIVKNLYEDAIVVCDVSAKNPNVMFELGLRLAFDKPVIVVKDDSTDYSFDTSPIEHLGYPRSLRHGTINAFKLKLTEKIKATHGKATTETGFSPFLKHFGSYDPRKLGTIDAGASEMIIGEIGRLGERLDRLITEKNRLPDPTKELIEKEELSPGYLLTAKDGTRYTIVRIGQESTIVKDNHDRRRIINLSQLTKDDWILTPF